MIAQSIRTLAVAGLTAVGVMSAPVQAWGEPFNDFRTTSASEYPKGKGRAYEASTTLKFFVPYSKRGKRIKINRAGSLKYVYINELTSAQKSVQRAIEAAAVDVRLILCGDLLSLSIVAIDWSVDYADESTMIKASGAIDPSTAYVRLIHEWSDGEYEPGLDIRTEPILTPVTSIQTGETRTLKFLALH